MQEKLTIARPYAAAAFAHALQENATAAWSELLRVLALAVADPGLAPYIGHPKVSKAQLMDVLAGVLGARLTPTGRNFVQALQDAERLELAPEIAELFERRRAAAAGRIEVEVTSAYPLSPAEHGRIDAAMRARLGRDCTVAARVDGSLIGGAVIKIGDSVIDLSLRGRLSALAQQLG